MKAKILLLALCALPAVGASPEQVLFSFDDRALPFQQGLRLQLIHYQVAKPRSVANVVLPPGPPGSPDARGCYYYGGVQRVKDELWMWYKGAGDQDGPGDPLDHPLRICFARSRDGIHWERRALGLVSYGGSTQNNLVGFGRGFHETIPVGELAVLYDPKDPNPARRFKMAVEATDYHSRLAVAFSADGLRWTESPANPVGPWLELSGLIKWHGAYYICCHARGHWSPVTDWTRVLDTFMSYDFEHWTQAPAMGFRRDPVPPRPVGLTGDEDGEQVHLGAGLWNRGNVIVGFYGQWHGVPSNDRRLVTIDLGLVVSHDALHYWEPIPDFRMVTSREVTYHLPYVRAPSLAQGQGFENVGDRTLVWYGAWAMPQDGIRVATWERDRLGYLQPFDSGREVPAYLLSAPVPTGGRPVAVSLNCSGLGEYSRLEVSVLDEQFRPMAGYGAADCTGPKTSGLRQRVTWTGRDTVAAAGPIRLRIDFVGVRPEDLKLYAAYVAPPSNSE